MAIIEDTTSRIKKEAEKFASDNLVDPTPREVSMIENAMITGAQIALEVAVKIYKEDWPK